MAMFAQQRHLRKPGVLQPPPYPFSPSALSPGVWGYLGVVFGMTRWLWLYAPYSHAGSLILFPGSGPSQFFAPCSLVVCSIV